MENSLSYQKPVNRYFRKVSLDDWYKSVDYYDNGNNLQSVIHLLRYINGPVPIPDGESINLKIPHGSVYVYIKADKENFVVDVPFLKFNSASIKLPAMRQMIEQNFSSLVLGQIILKDEELWYHYADKTANCEPYKIYYTLDEICNQADNNDDYYIDRFKLEHVQNPDLAYFSQADTDASKVRIKDIIKEGISYAEHFESKRWYNTSCDILAITFLKIRYSIFPQGILGRDVQDAFYSMYENDAVTNIIQKSKDKLNKFLNYDEHKYKDSLFYPQFLMPIKPRAEIPKVQEHLGAAYGRVKDGLTNRAYQDTAIHLIYAIYNLIDLYTIPPEIQAALETILDKISGKDWKSSAETLVSIITKILAIQLDADGNVVPGTLNLSDGSNDVLSGVGSVKSIFSKITNIFKK